MISINSTPFGYFLLLVFGIETIVALLGNGFIIIINIYRWLQSRKMLPSDLLLTSLGTSRFLIQFVGLIMEFLHYFNSGLFSYTSIGSGFFYTWIYFSSVSIWCATLLSVFYCVKITNFAHTILWLKSRIDRLVPKLLGLSLVIFSLLYVAVHLKLKDYSSETGNKTENVRQKEEIWSYKQWVFAYLYFTFSAINVSICLTASFLLLISLWRHTRNLKKSGFATKDLNTQAHISVVYSLSSFLFFYILHIVVAIFSMGYSINIGSTEGFLCNVVHSLSSSVHSIILILTNPKLKEVFMQVLKISVHASPKTT